MFSEPLSFILFPMLFNVVFTFVSKFNVNSNKLQHISEIVLCNKAGFKDRVPLQVRLFTMNQFDQLSLLSRFSEDNFLYVVVRYLFIFKYLQTLLNILAMSQYRLRLLTQELQFVKY